MQVPKLEKMTKEDIVKYMQKCAKQYVPEWRYDKENPDAGTALVSLFSDMLYDNIERLNQSVLGDMLSFFDEMNAKLLPAKPAEGFITFELPGDLESEAEVPRGTKLISDIEQEQMIFETQDDVLVRQMDMSRIYLSVPEEDGIYQI